MTRLEFEKQIHDLEEKIDGLRNLSADNGVDLVREIVTLQKKTDKLLKDTYEKLSPWEKVQVARHPGRPHSLEYINELIQDFVELSGDRLYGEDSAIIGGLGTLQGRPVMVIGQEKGHDMDSRMKHNFGMPKPEGYRKAQRLMRLAEHYKLPVITLVDTSGADPRVEAEERGQAEAIARSMDIALSLKVPTVTAIIGEGCSGGAMAIAIANSVLMLEHAVYTVISPEGCASILWRSADKKQEAAAAQKITAQDLLKLKLIDKIIPEPLGGAHRNPKVAIQSLGNELEKQLKNLSTFTPRQLVAQRRQKFLDMGRSLKI